MEISNNTLGRRWFTVKFIWPPLAQSLALSLWGKIIMVNQGNIVVDPIYGSSNWTQDVLATLNQRRWRWFSVARTSCVQYRYRLTSPVQSPPSHLPKWWCCHTVHCPCMRSVTTGHSGYSDRLLIHPEWIMHYHTHTPPHSQSEYRKKSLKLLHSEQGTSTQGSRLNAGPESAKLVIIQARLGRGRVIADKPSFWHLSRTMWAWPWCSGYHYRRSRRGSAIRFLIVVFRFQRNKKFYPITGKYSILWRASATDK